MSNDQTTTFDPEILITVSQMINGKRIQTLKRIDLFSWSQARSGMADRAIGEALSEIRHYRENLKGAENV